MGKKSDEYYPLYRLTNMKTQEVFEARGFRMVLEKAGMSRVTSKKAINQSKKWELEELAPPEKWDEANYRQQLYQNTKGRYKQYENIKVAKDPLYEKRKRMRLAGWLNPDGSSFTAEQHSAMLEDVCGICNAVEDIVVDHCHETMVVRGPLCRKCNLALGHVDDSIEIVENMLHYLRKHKDLNYGSTN